MRRSARTDLCGGRSAMIVPTATGKPLHDERPAFRLTPSHPGKCRKWPMLREYGLSRRLPGEFADWPRFPAWRHLARVSQSF